MLFVNFRPNKKNGHNGECPFVSEFALFAIADVKFSACVFSCEDDSDCEDTQKCCPTSCRGKRCMEAIEVEPPPTLKSIKSRTAQKHTTVVVCFSSCYMLQGFLEKGQFSLGHFLESNFIKLVWNRK